MEQQSEIYKVPGVDENATPAKEKKKRKHANNDDEVRLRCADSARSCNE